MKPKENKANQNLKAEFLPYENTFKLERMAPWVVRHRPLVLFTCFILITLSTPALKWDFKKYSDEELDKIAITVGLGDLKSLKRIIHRSRNFEVDEVFGNQYVKDKNKKKVAYIDPRITYAVNPIVSGASMPVDLSPNIQPKYTAAARAAGIEGSLTLEIIVAEDGEVLRVRTVGKKLGFGLERMAAVAFKKKLYKPSINVKGEPIVGKFYQPVRYQLD